QSCVRHNLPIPISHFQLLPLFPQCWILYLFRAGLCVPGELPDTWWCVPTEGVLNLPIGALIQVSGIELDDQSASRSILREAHTIGGLVKGRHVIVGVQHRDEDVSCA
uniref:Uncharacterized protein n=1 Tax=Cyanistes caeruleus TaxID=156563 RepID=A0A8C0V4V8_CYACU